MGSEVADLQPKAPSFIRRVALSSCKEKFSTREDLIQAIQDAIAAMNEVKIKFNSPASYHERVSRAKNERIRHLMAQMWGHAKVKELSDEPAPDPFNENPTYLISRLLEKIMTALRDPSLKSQSLRDAVIEHIANAQQDNDRYFAQKLEDPNETSPIDFMGTLHKMGLLDYLEEVIFMEESENMPTTALALTAIFRKRCLLTIKI